MTEFYYLEIILYCITLPNPGELLIKRLKYLIYKTDFYNSDIII